jgi:hypothetical protein
MPALVGLGVWGYFALPFVRDGKNFIVPKAGAHDFMLKQWQQREGGAAFITQQTDEASLRCDDLSWIYTAKNGRVVLVTDATAMHKDCGQVDLIVTPLWQAKCSVGSETKVIDGAWMKWHGALAVRLNSVSESDITTVREHWCARPWVPGWKEIGL